MVSPLSHLLQDPKEWAQNWIKKQLQEPLKEYKPYEDHDHDDMCDCKIECQCNDPYCREVEGYVSEHEGHVINCSCGECHRYFGKLR